MRYHIVSGLLLQAEFPEAVENHVQSYAYAQSMRGFRLTQLRQK